LREFVPSKKLLLHGVIYDENPTNNGETFIIYSVAAIAKY